MTDPAGSGRPRTRPRDATEPLPIVAAPEEAADRSAVPPAPVARARPRRWRWVATAVLAALVAVVAFTAANAWLAAEVEARVAEEVERELGAPVDVELHGAAVGFRALTGEVPAVELHGREVPLGDTTAVMRDLRVWLTDVRVDRDRGRVEAAHADVDMTLDDDAVQALLGGVVRLPLVDLELQPGALRVNVAGFALADATVRAEGGDVVVGLAAPLDRLVPTELRLSDFPLGVRIDDVRLSDGEMRLHGRAEPLVVDGAG